MELEIGKEYEAVAKKIFPYGAFMEIEGYQKLVLLHVSNISKNYIKNIEDYIKLNEKYKVVVIKSKDDKLGLSLITNDAPKKSEDKYKNIRSILDEEPKQHTALDDMIEAANKVYSDKIKSFNKSKHNFVGYSKKRRK